jgi:hypothetical protein
MIQDKTCELIRALQRFVSSILYPSHSPDLCRISIRLNPFSVKAYLQVILFASNSVATEKATKSRIDSLWSGLVTHPLVIDSFQKYQNQIPNKRIPLSSKSLLPLSSSSTSSSLKAVSSRRKVEVGKHQEHDNIGRDIIPNDQEKLSLLVSDRTIATRVRHLKENGS